MNNIDIFNMNLDQLDESYKKGTMNYENNKKEYLENIEKDNSERPCCDVNFRYDHYDISNAISNEKNRIIKIVDTFILNYDDFASARVDDRALHDNTIDELNRLLKLIK